MGRLRRSKQSRLRTALAVGALSTAVIVAMPGLARAEGFLDFLFGGFQQRPPPQASSYADPSVPMGRVSPAPLGTESVQQGGGSTGRSVAYCVRLCDGQHFPMGHMANATPIETCRAMCPTAKTKVFFGSEIDHAIARDGQRYADTDNAFIYRKQLVANCSCNGKDAFGLAPLDVRNDATLRPGDIVSTKTGLVAYSGKRGQIATFTPVDSSALTAAPNPGTSRVRLSKRAEPSLADADDEPGTIVQSQDGQPQGLSPIVDLRGQVAR